MYPTISSYHQAVDPLVFFQDEQLPGGHAYNADLFTMIENRIWSLQDYLLRKERKAIYHFSETEPEPEQGFIWID